MTWHNVDESCMLCEMEKRTHWYFEDDNIVIADTLGANAHPFVVIKDHRDEIETIEQGYIEGAVSATFPDREFSLDVRMGMVPDHFHVHVVFHDEDVDLSDE